jgi:hypothetical protein
VPREMKAFNSGLPQLPLRPVRQIEPRSADPVAGCKRLARKRTIATVRKGRERTFVRSGRGIDRSPALRAPEQMLGEGARGTIDVGESECYRE